LANPAAAALLSTLCIYRFYWWPCHNGMCNARSEEPLAFFCFNAPTLVVRLDTVPTRQGQETLCFAMQITIQNLAGNSRCNHLAVSRMSD